MTLYKFKTFRTSYYFPDFSKRNEILYSLYAPLGRRKIAKWVWWAFKYVPPFRWMFKCSNPNEEFPYDKIVSLCPNDSVISFNMGTPGEEQKISMLGIDPHGKRFFAKYSQKCVAQELSRNEIDVLKNLQELGVAPELLDSTIDNEFVFFRTTCVEGKNPTDKSLNKEVWGLLNMLRELHLPTNCEFDGLRTCLSHGDFTSWNMIVKEGEYKLIDWEMAAERPLGYDIFTFTLRQEMLTSKLSPKEIVETHKEDYSQYFIHYEITDYTPYLQWYAKELVGKYDGLRELINED